MFGDILAFGSAALHLFIYLLNLFEAAKLCIAIVYIKFVQCDWWKHQTEGSFHQGGAPNARGWLQRAKACLIMQSVDEHGEVWEGEHADKIAAAGSFRAERE